jgi:glycosyltransferase involved in cell wall biosynthesis
MAYRAKLWRLFMRDDGDGVQVRRTWLMPFPNRKSWERMLNYASFAVSAVVRGLFLSSPEIVIATSPQLLVGLSGLALAKWHGVPFIFEVRDLWPESLEAVGATGKNSFLMKILGRVAALLYEHSNHIVVVTHAFKTYLQEHWKVPEDKISVVMNGVDHNLFQPQDSSADIRQHFGMEDRFVVSYIGTIGNAHGVDTLLDAAELLRTGCPEVLFLLMGDGAEKGKLDKIVEKRNLINIHLAGSQPRSKVAAVIAASDICLVMLRKSELFKTVLPTKLLEFMACERPVILAVEGEAAALLNRADAGICVPPEDPEALVKAVRTLKEDTALRQRYGRNGRSFVEAELTREQTAISYLEVLRRLIDAGAIKTRDQFEHPISD